MPGPLLADLNRALPPYIQFGCSDDEFVLFCWVYRLRKPRFPSPDSIHLRIVPPYARSDVQRPLLQHKYLPRH